MSGLVENPATTGDVVTTLGGVIVLDSNQLRFALPDSPTYKLLAIIAQQAGHTLATTDIVLREVVRQRHEELRAVLGTLAKARQEANRLMGPQSRIPVRQVLDQSAINIPTPANVAAREAIRFEEDICDAYQILAADPADALDALLMEASHQPPCRDGRGARDMTIWRTAADACRTPDKDSKGRPLPVIFVSQDRDFTAPGKTSALAEELRNDDTEAGRLVLTPTVVDLMELLGHRRELIAADEIAQSADVQEAVIAATDVETFPSPWHRSRLEHPELEIVTRFTNGGKAHRCRSDSLTLTSFSGTWSLRFVTKRFPHLSDGRGGGYRGFSLSVEGMGLVVEDRVSGTTEVEFIASRIFGPEPG